MSIEALVLLAALLFKHFLIDFPLQTKYQYANKHIWMHAGGLLHGFLHGASTFLLLCLISSLPVVACVVIGWLEWTIHYTIDWAKMNINMKMKWACNNSEYFWWLTGFDQFLHYATYWCIMFFTYQIGWHHVGAS